MTPVIGMVVCFAGPFVPRDWATCDGQTLLISENPLLFKVLGTLYGGNGITTFNLPDLRGRTAVSTGQSEFHNYQQGESTGTETLTLTTGQMPLHTHSGTVSLKPGARTEIGIDPTANDGYPSEFTGAYAKSGDKFMVEPAYTVAMREAGAGKPVNIRSPYLVISYIICLKGIFPSRP